MTRILVLGDSFTFGVGGDYDAIWPVLFERRLTAESYSVDVIKAGVPGYDTRSEVLYLERIVPAYDPDIVLLAFLANDLSTNRPIERVDEVAEEDETSPVCKRADKAATLHSVTLAKRLMMANDWLYRRLYMLTGRGAYYATPSGGTLLGQVEITKALLERGHRLSREHRAALAVLSIPRLFQLLVPDDDEALGVDVDLIDSMFAGWAQPHFPWLPALSEMREAQRSGGEDPYYRFDGHLTDRGNRVVADYLAAAFVQHFANRLDRMSSTDQLSEAGRAAA